MARLVMVMRDLINSEIKHTNVDRAYWHGVATRIVDRGGFAKKMETSLLGEDDTPSFYFDISDLPLEIPDSFWRVMFQKLLNDHTFLDKRLLSNIRFGFGDPESVQTDWQISESYRIFKMVSDHVRYTDHARKSGRLSRKVDKEAQDIVSDWRNRLSAVRGFMITYTGEGPLDKAEVAAKIQFYTHEHHLVEGYIPLDAPSITEAVTRLLNQQERKPDEPT